ncbi:type II toxin-antitoxin system prevent-host-death family antitoxin [Skermania sp. ID1734]|uniref:type II toxin-antitoxin system Phd/YefM family antitoxin n=1 Tax=Skermania sp. ID1734 TaxID=2597516 RepID=UPI00117E131E|nr:type II toxin-antitoxin system prevent-host-death family antitoxin [Skermania sp. ID1734]TSD93136.1 type II toxin-antitoxin system prevent-host-death family antitoxin [Skermania sp. ID1734]
MEQYNIHEAKSQLSRIIERVESGEDVVISRAGVPVARVVRYRRGASRTARGSLAAKVRFAPDWDSEETNAAIATEFEGGR